MTARRSDFERGRVTASTGHDQVNLEERADGQASHADARPPGQLASRKIGRIDRVHALEVLLEVRQVNPGEGVHATGIDRILSDAGAAKMTLYKQFGSKEGLLYAVLEREGESWRDWLKTALEKKGSDAASQLASLFDALEDWFGQDDYYGCTFINAVAEYKKDDVNIRAITLDHKKKVLGYLTSLAEKAGYKNPESLVHQLGILMDGAIVAALVTGDPKIARNASAAAAVLLSSAAPTPDSAASAA